MAYARSWSLTALVLGVGIASTWSLQPCFTGPGLGPASEVRMPHAKPAAPTLNARAPASAAWAAVALAGAACAVPREVKSAMQAKHDKKTFRGKLHAHSFGKYRLRKNKARRIQAIKNGTFDPDTVVQQGQPEPEHCWDSDNLMENPIYYAPDYLKEAMCDYWDDVNDAMRKKWKEYMGVKGNQRYFKNWTPPGVQTAQP